MVRERGAVAAEFAFVFVTFIVLVVAVMEFARLMLAYCAAVEATRMGARMAVVCGSSAQSVVKAKMKQRLSLLEASKIDIHYPTTSCRVASCDAVTVAVKGLSMKLSIPLVGLTFPIPSFSTSLSAESVNSSNNPLCS